MTAVALFPICWTATRWIGFTAYSATSMVCLVLWLRFRKVPLLESQKFSRLALSSTVIEFLLALDMIFEWRIALHSYTIHLFMRKGLYGGRHTLQVALLFALGGLLLVSLLYWVYRFGSRGGGLLTASALSMSLTLWLSEIISLHETDSNLYHLVNGVMVIAFLWIATCSLTLLGVGLEARFLAYQNRLKR